MSIYVNDKKLFNLSDLQIGGRNLVLSQQVNPVSYITGNATDFTIAPTDGKYTYAEFFLSEPIDKSETYTVSFDVDEFNTNHSKNLKVAFYNSTATVEYGKTIVPVSSRVVCQIKAYSNTDIDNSKSSTLLIYAGEPGDTQNNKLYVRHLKLEKGNIATDWSPAPEDILNRLDKLEKNGG